jgi:hypothetical protein
MNPIFLSPSADSAIVAYGYDGWKGERLGPTLSLKGEGVCGWKLIIRVMPCYSEFLYIFL